MTTRANARMPDESFETVAHRLRPEQPVGPKGGRHRVIWLVHTTAARREDVPAELGCPGRTAHRRLRAWEEAGIWDRLRADLPAAPKRAGKLDLGTVIIDGATVRAFGGGEATGPSPVDRRADPARNPPSWSTSRACPRSSAPPGPMPATTGRPCR